MNQPKLSPLFQAAKKGDVAELSQLLQRGEGVDPQDHERMTPLMRAAEGGHLEALQTLVKAGANVNAVGMDQTDVLEMAASGGNVEIVRFLLSQGAPVEGHWQPRSKVGERMGHMTPLICAAIEGHVEVIRLLLDAGANREAKYDGQTALKMLKEELKFPTFDEKGEKKEAYQAIVALLSGASDQGSSAKEADSSESDVAAFAANAKKQGYQEFRKKLEERCGKGRNWKPAADHGIAATDVLIFTLQGCKKERDLQSLMDDAQKAGCYLVLPEPWEPGGEAKLVLFPTNDASAVVAAMGTAGPNYSVTTGDVIAWQRELNKDNPFVLRYCSHELVGGDFSGAVKRVKAVAERMVELCPCVLAGGFEDADEFAAAMKRQKGFLLRWD